MAPPNIDVTIVAESGDMRADPENPWPLKGKESVRNKNKT